VPEARHCVCSHQPGHRQVSLQLLYLCKYLFDSLNGKTFLLQANLHIQDEDCSNLVFLAQLAKDLRNQYNAALNSVILKAKKVEELNFDMKEEKLK